MEDMTLIIAVTMSMAIFCSWLVLRYLDGPQPVEPTESQISLCVEHNQHTMEACWGEADMWGTQRRKCICCGIIQRSDDRTWKKVIKED